MSKGQAKLQAAALALQVAAPDRVNAGQLPQLRLASTCTPDPVSQHAQALQPLLSLSLLLQDHYCISWLALRLAVSAGTCRAQSAASC